MVYAPVPNMGAGIATRALAGGHRVLHMTLQQTLGTNWASAIKILS